MLPRHVRMRRAEDFRRTVRHGLRVARPSLVLHARHTEPSLTDDPGDRAGVRVGFVVSKAVGPAVRRNLVRRRLRHLVADRLSSLPAGTDLVVRALPAAGIDPDSVRTDLPAAWTTLLRRWARA